MAQGHGTFGKHGYIKQAGNKRKDRLKKQAKSDQIMKACCVIFLLLLFFVKCNVILVIQNAVILSV